MPYAIAAAAVVGIGSAVVSKALAPKAPGTPDYSGVAQADARTAQMQYDTQQNQLDWAKQQYNDQEPYTKQFLQESLDAAHTNAANAAADRKRYQDIYQPVEDQFVKQATTWNNPDRSNQAAGAAMADVSNQFDAQRTASQAQLESFGIDPSQTRFAALDLGTRVSQAAATAGAGTQSRLNTEATGLGLEGEAINIGKGYPGQVAQSYNTATNAGQAGINSQTGATAAAGNVMNGTVGFANAGNNASANEVGALNTGFSNRMSAATFNYNSQRNTQNDIGQLAGGALGAAGY